MNKELSDLLCSYLGELMYQADHEYDWIEKEKLLTKIGAANVLLGTQPKEKRRSYMDRVLEAIKDIKP